MHAFPIPIGAAGCALLGALAAAAAGCSSSDSLRSTEPPSVADGPRIFESVKRITSFGVRLPDSPGSIGAAEYVRDQFSSFGLANVAIEQADTVVWSAERFGLSIAGEAVPAYYMQHTFHEGVPARFSTGPDGLNAEIVYVGDGKPQDFEDLDVRGKIVLSDVRFNRLSRSIVEQIALGIQDTNETFVPGFELVDPYSRNTFPANYYNALERGAVGFVGVLVDYIDSHDYHNEAYSSYDPGGAMSIPGLWLAPSTGAALKARLHDAAAPLVARLTLEGELARAQGRNVVGYLPGTSDEIVLIESHHDSTTTGAVEDASGTSLVLALAQYFSRVPERERQRTLLFATMDTHFTDYASHEAFITRHIEREKIVFNVTLEHIAHEVLQTPAGAQKTGLLAPRGLFVSNEIEGVEQIALRAMERHQLERTVAFPTSLFGGAGLPADCSDFYRAGLPVLALVGAPIYLYDSMDTLDKVPVDELGRVARAFADVVSELDALPSSAFRRLSYGPR
ncbi:MAG TPA: M28 family peptidase [Polyangiaceae bacterium]